MEYSNSLTATVYIVNNGKILLHQHKKYKTWFPTGGHLESSELPHEAAVREAKEETGFDVNLVTTEFAPAIDLGRVKRVPAPFCVLFEGDVDEQFLDFIYVATTTEINPYPQNGESTIFKWFSIDELQSPEIKTHVKNTATAILRTLYGDGGITASPPDGLPHKQTV